MLPRGQSSRRESSSSKLLNVAPVRLAGCGAPTPARQLRRNGVCRPPRPIRERVEVGAWVDASIDVRGGLAGGLAGRGRVAHDSSATRGNAATQVKPSALVVIGTPARPRARSRCRRRWRIPHGGRRGRSRGSAPRDTGVRPARRGRTWRSHRKRPRCRIRDSRHAGRRRDAVVGGQADDDQRLVAGSSQLRLERGPDEAAIHALLDHPLVWSGRRLDLERVPGLVGTQGGGGVGRHVFHVDDRTVARAPGVEQLCDPRFHRRVVPPPPPRRVESLLDVDDEQQGLGICRALHRGAEPPRSGSGVQSADGAHRPSRC